MTKFRKKPVVIDAIQLPELEVDMSETEKAELHHLLRGADWHSGHEGTLIIETLEGSMTASPGDWIIRGVNGECYPCKPDIFDKSYELVE